MTLGVAELVQLELFQQLSADRLQWICDRVQPLLLKQGEVLVREGDRPRGFLLVLAGELGVTRQSEGVEMPVGQQVAPSFLGEIPILTDEPVLVTVRALTDCRLYELPGADFLTLLHHCREFERLIFRTVYRRVRGLEAFIQNREKLAALGTLSAGLAHELNNPAAALVRVLKDLPAALQELERMSLIYGQRQVDAAHTQQWLDAREQGFNAILQQKITGIALSDREDELRDWLEAYGLENAWELAAPLAAGDTTLETLSHLTAPWQNDPTELRDQGLRWLALSFDVISAIANGLAGAERISQMVQAMKSYSQMDRGAQQVVDIHEGLDATLQLFAFQLRGGLTVHRRYDPTVPPVLAYGSELNQAWTHLMDNAIAAMGEQGILTLKTTFDGQRIQVQIIDNGSGIAPELQSRIFEPFFTTKPFGEGSGLGLDAVRRIIENRHHGTVTVSSKPGQTCFTICLPVAPQVMSAPPSP